MIRLSALFVGFTWSHAFVTLQNQFVPSSLNAVRRARDLVQSLIDEEGLYGTVAGARAFCDVCAVNVIYEDRFHPQPFVGKQTIQDYLSDNLRSIRVDAISDGDCACGFAWTWVTGDGAEGLRGTTFVELNGQGQIQYVQEIPEPLFKPGDLTKKLLQAVTADQSWGDFQPFTQQTPQTASDMAKYLYIDLQQADPAAATDEFMRLVDDNIIYQDFNYEHHMTGRAQVREFIEGFRFPGITFRPLRFDDGIDSTCFTWEVQLADAPDTIAGMSFYQISPESKKITYVRDVPESAVKPPILGKLARQWRPKLGTFRAYDIDSRNIIPND